MTTFLLIFYIDCLQDSLSEIQESLGNPIIYPDAHIGPKLCWLQSDLRNTFSTAQGI